MKPKTTEELKRTEEFTQMDAFPRNNFARDFQGLFKGIKL